MAFQVVTVTIRAAAAVAVADDAAAAAAAAAAPAPAPAPDPAAAPAAAPAGARAGEVWAPLAAAVYSSYRSRVNGTSNRRQRFQHQESRSMHSIRSMNICEDTGKRCRRFACSRSSYWN